MIRFRLNKLSWENLQVKKPHIEKKSKNESATADVQGDTVEPWL